MFIVKSAFWLTIGFLLVAPHGTNFGANLGAAKDQALAAGMKAGEQLIVSQILSNQAGPQTAAVSLTASAPSPDLTMQNSSGRSAVVFPRPRPLSMG